LSQLYLGSAVLKRFEDDGRPAEDLPLARWGLEDILHRIEDAFAGLIQNFPNRPAAWLLRAVTLPLGRRQAPPGDRLGHEVAERLLAPSAVRDRLTAGMYLPKAAAEPLAQLERALEAAIRAEAVEAKIRAAAKEGALLLRGREDETKLALELGVITREEFDALVEARALRREVIMVDDFPPDFGIARKSEAAAQTVGARKTA
jgi:acyl-CoA dehydrogenase